jgi:hypothetical protein
MVYESLRRERPRGIAGLKELSLTDRILLASSVSGGSLASGYLLERSRRDVRTRAEDEHSERASFTRRHPARDLLLQEIDRLDTMAARKPGQLAPERAASWPLDSAFVVDMTTDFMAPLLRGILNIGRERGDSVADFWRDRFGWKGDNLSLDPARAGKSPVVLFNATRVDRGTRVVLSFPVAPADLLHGVNASSSAEPLRLSTAEAVRVSANFPWGFEIAQFVPTASIQVGNASHMVFLPGAGPQAPSTLSPAEAPDDSADDISTYTDLIDGGVVDNTGLDSLATFLERLAETALERGGPEWQRADQIAAALVRRGLVVVEIDAGARPDEPSWLARQFPNLTRPAQALALAAHVNASEIRTRNLERIRRSLQNIADPAGRQVTVGAVRAGFRCDPKGDVMTAWALSLGDQARIIREFVGVEPRFLNNLRTTFRAVAALQASHSSTDAENASAQKELRGQFVAFQDQMVKVDHSQRSGALDCRSSKPLESAETTERERVLAALKRLEFAPTPTKPVAGAAPADGGAQGVPAPYQPSSTPEPMAVIPLLAGARQEPQATLRRIGWLYLGEHDREKEAWRRITIQAPSSRPLPRVGTEVVLAGRSFVRADIPSRAAEMAPVLGTLRPGSKVQVLAVERWEGTAFVWAKVAF